MSEHYRNDPAAGCGIAMIGAIIVIVVLIVALVVWWVGWL